MKPSAVCSVSRLPARSGGAASATSAENCAESGMTAAPQASTSAAISQAGPPKAAAVAEAGRGAGHHRALRDPRLADPVGEPARRHAEQAAERDGGEGQQPRGAPAPLAERPAKATVAAAPIQAQKA